MFKMADAPHAFGIKSRLCRLVSFSEGWVSELQCTQAYVRSVFVRSRAAPPHVSLWKLTRHAHAFLQVHASKQEMAEV